MMKLSQISAGYSGSGEKNSHPSSSNEPALFSRFYSAIFPHAAIKVPGLFPTGLKFFVQAMKPYIAMCASSHKSINSFPESLITILYAVPVIVSSVMRHKRFSLLHLFNGRGEKYQVFCP
ncbi:MAG: hypothetical protein QM578_20540 [Pantoea sp.]|uniref:hypothetical protein n=1 Tax=Pantoea sp. TaxID=69393 RepID=UPI0039E526F0